MVDVSTRSRRAIGLSLIVMAWLFTVYYALHSKRPIVIDELGHTGQIIDFLNGRFKINTWLEMIPGYHVVMAILIKALGLITPEPMRYARAVNAIFGLGAGVVFFAIRKHLGDNQALLSTSLFFFLPFLYPFYFLVYTDTLSVALVLFAMFAALKQRHWMAACILILSILIRQNNVVWAGLLPTLMAWPLLVEARGNLHRCWRAVASIVLPYFLPVAIFLIYWAINGSIVMNKEALPWHAKSGPHGGNIYFFLFVYLIFFPAEILEGLKRSREALRNRPWLIIIPLLCIFLIRMKGNPINYLFSDPFLHNRLLVLVQSGYGHWIFNSMAAVAICCIPWTRFMLPQSWLVYPFFAIYLGSLWMIEIRYVLIPFALWMALKKPFSQNMEWVTLIYWLTVTCFFTYGIFSNLFML